MYIDIPSCAYALTHVDASGLHGSSTTFLRTPIYLVLHWQVGRFQLASLQLQLLWRTGVSSATSWWLGSLATPGSHHLLAHPPGPSLWRKHLRWCFFFCFFHWLASCSFGLLLLRALFSDWRSLNRFFWFVFYPSWACYLLYVPGMALAGLRLRDRLRLLPRRPCWVRTAPWCSAGVGTAARLPPSGFLHIFCSASTAWHPLLLLVLTGLASGFYSVFTCFFGGKLLLLLLPASTGITLRVHVLVAEDRSYRLHSRCPSSAAAPASSPTSASGFSALAGSPGYDCTLLARYFRYAYVCPLTTLVFSCSPTSAAAPSFSMGYARHHHLRFTSSSAVWFSLSSSFSFFPSSQHGGK